MAGIQQIFDEYTITTHSVLPQIKELCENLCCNTNIEIKAAQPQAIYFSKIKRVRKILI